MLSFAAPGALWIALAILPVAALYFLRMRFRRKQVGSTFIWRSLAAATSGGDALKRRSVLLLLLQVAAIALAAFAAAGPSIVSRRLVKAGTIYLVDVSASMAARDGILEIGGGKAEASRVEAAAAAAGREIEKLADDVPVMVFACSSTATPVMAEPAMGRAALGALKKLVPGSEAFSEAACADALSGWMARNEGSWQACLLTDGGLDLGGRTLAAAFGGAMRVVTLGSGGASLGVTGLRLEAGAQGGADVQARFTLWNGWPNAKPAKVTIAKGKDVLGSATIDAAPGWSRANLKLPGTIEEGAYELSLERDKADLGSAPGEVYRLAVNPRRPLSVLLVGRSDPFLKAALAYGGISYSSVEEFPSSPPSADIVIAEYAKLPAGTRGHLLVFGPPPPDAPLAAAGSASGPILTTEASHPLTRFVSWEGAAISAGLGYSVKGQALVLATAGGSPVLVAWEKDGYRSLACGIDLSRSDLGLKSAFPVLLRNFFEWCVPRTDEESAYTLVAGEAARRAEDATFKANGVELSRTGPSVLLTAREAGLFEWTDGRNRGSIAANVPAGELDATPRTLQIAASGEAGGGQGSAPALASIEKTSSVPIGPWAMLLLAACLALEWLAWKGSPLLEKRRSSARRKAAA